MPTTATERGVGWESESGLAVAGIVHRQGDLLALGEQRALRWALAGNRTVLGLVGCRHDDRGRVDAPTCIVEVADRVGELLAVTLGMGSLPIDTERVTGAPGATVVNAFGF